MQSTALYKRTRIVLVETEHELNLGYCARTAANFGFKNLVLVNPKADPTGKDATKYSKHARKVLENACVVKSLAEATRGCSIVAATSGVVLRGKGIVRTPMSPRAFASRMKNVDGEIAIVFGREGTGLTSSEVNACDVLVRVPADFTYPVLNISHAMAVILYEVRMLSRPKVVKRADAGTREALARQFDELTQRFSHLRNADKVRQAFRRILARAVVSDLEAKALLSVFRPTAEALAKPSVLKSRNEQKKI